MGIVTTDAVVGASPSAAYAHAAYRNWRADSELPEEARGKCKDIAAQLVEDNLDIQVSTDELSGIKKLYRKYRVFAIFYLQVVLGGGRKYFLSKTQADPEYPDVKGIRDDGRDLTKVQE